MLITINTYIVIWFDLCLEFSLLDINVGKNVIIFRVDMSPCLHIDNKKEDILILGIGLDDTMLTAEAYYSISFSRSIEHFV